MQHIFFQNWQKTMQFFPNWHEHGRIPNGLRKKPWSNIGFGEEITQIESFEVHFTHLIWCYGIEKRCCLVPCFIQGSWRSREAKLMEHCFFFITVFVLVCMYIQYCTLLNWSYLQFRCSPVPVPVNWNNVVISPCILGAWWDAE